MKKIIKTLALIITGLVVGVGIKRVKKVNSEISNLKEFDRFLQQLIQSQ